MGIWLLYYLSTNTDLIFDMVFYVTFGCRSRGVSLLIIHNSIWS